MCEVPVKSVLSFSRIFIFWQTGNNNMTQKQTLRTKSRGGLRVTVELPVLAELLPPRRALNQIPSPINST